VLAPPFGPKFLDLSQTYLQERQKLCVAGVVLLDTLAITGGDIGFVVFIKEVGLNLASQIPGVQSTFIR